MKKEKWNGENIPNLSGKVAIVTGSSSGIGFETARVIASKNAEVILAVRNFEKGNKAAGKIRIEFPDAKINIMTVDLASLASIKNFVSAFREKHNQLHYLINNAGVMVPPYSKTEEGFELQFGTNHLGHFALTGQLMEVLKNTDRARIVNVSSGAHKIGAINFNDLGWENRKYSPWKAYGDSKISNLYFTFELQRKLKKINNNIKVTAAHPGWTATELQRHTGLARFLNNFFAQDISMGALPTLRAAFDNNVAGSEYFGPEGFMEMKGYPKLVQPNNLSLNENIAGKLWNVSEKLTGVKFNLDE